MAPHRSAAIEAIEERSKVEKNAILQGGAGKNGSNEAAATAFRDYEMLDETSTVAQFYKTQHEKQTLEYVQDAKSRFYGFNHAKHSLMELFEASDAIVDESDPDLHLSQLHHAIQTAERARSIYPEPDMDWFWFTAFIHDLGKILTIFGEPQWGVVGDTFPVGCAFEDTSVYPESFKLNPDYGKYDKLGIYTANCGFDKVHFAFSHDDYLSQALEHNGHNLPYEALYCIRYHSFYPWHKNGGYAHLASERDHELLPLLRKFQACDLYSKDDENLLDYKALDAFYSGLADKFIGVGKVMEL
jgi:inositol oxygenase